MILLSIMVVLTGCDKDEDVIEAPQVATGVSRNITFSGATLSGEIVAGGASITDRGFYISTSANAVTSGVKTEFDISTRNNFSLTLNGLQKNTTYYYAAYASNEKGTAYGEERMFITDFTVPQVATGAGSDITLDSAVLAGELVSEGGSAIIEIGIYYSTGANPVEDGIKVTSQNGMDESGKFSVLLGDLQASTTYYYVAFATNAKGIAYGEIKTFSTDNDTNIITASASEGGTIAPEGTVTVPYGADQTFTFTPAINYEINQVLVDGVDNPSAVSAGSYTFTDVKEAHTIAVIFSSSELIELVFVEGGTFNMGSDGNAPDGSPLVNGTYNAGRQSPVHPVTLSSFSIGKYEVTQAEWKAIMGANNNPSTFHVGNQFPVQNVSYDTAIAFIAELNTQTGKNYRLPTDAEWEYAARGGQLSQNYLYSGSNNIDEVAWYSGNSGNTTWAVGLKKANELGIYDMTGNVSEWTSDYFENYTVEPQTNPTVLSGTYRIFRGGCFAEFHQSLWTTFRDRINYTTAPGTNDHRFGIRLVLPAE
ncbi:MAG: formylglycine-generating enzyme family protein [Tannerella sp.]|nr:formylglycine-generating enzyme family protein [Tannerella sp.]